MTDTASNKYKRVCTIATECLHTVFEKALSEKHGENWFKNLAEECKISSTKKNIYSLLLEDLLKVLAENGFSAAAIIKTSDRPDELKKAAKDAFNAVKALRIKPDTNLESAEYITAAKQVAEVIDGFPAVRDEEGKTYISKILNRLNVGEQVDVTPTYSVKETISKNRINITENEFISCCVANKIPVVFDGKEALFKTQNFAAVKDLMNKAAKLSFDSKKKTETKKQYMKIAAVSLAVALIFVSSAITNSITKATLTKKYEGNDSSSNIFGFLNTDTSSADENITESNNEISAVINQNGRIKESFEINYIYDGNFKMMNPELGNVYMHFSKFEYWEYGKEYDISYIIYNRSDKAIRNIGFDVTVLNEQKQVVFTHTVDKVISNGNSISVTAGSSHWLNVDVPEDAVRIKNPDLGVCTFKVDLYYDTIE